MNQKFGGVIWTNHVLDRLKQRGIKQGDAWATLRHPDRSRYAATRGAWVYEKNWGKDVIEVVAKKNDRKEWLVLSVWSKPSYGNKRDTFWRRVMRIIFGL